MGNKSASSFMCRVLRLLLVFKTSSVRLSMVFVISEDRRSSR
jgi:hypothetical protein